MWWIIGGVLLTVSIYIVCNALYNLYGLGKVNGWSNDDDDI